MFYTLQGELFGMGPVQNRTDDDRNAALIPDVGGHTQFVP